MANFADTQLRALIAAGVNPIDAQRSVSWVLANVPADADPETWIPPAALLAGGMFATPITEADVHDARVAWYADESVPARWKRLLDAPGATE